MSLAYSVFKEPLIEFRHGQALEDPHDGLSLFGPFDADSPSHPKKITYGVISTKEGLTLFEEWSKILNSPQISEPEKLKLGLLFQDLRLLLLVNGQINPLGVTWLVKRR